MCFSSSTFFPAVPYSIPSVLRISYIFDPKSRDFTNPKAEISPSLPSHTSGFGTRSEHTDNTTRIRKALNIQKKTDDDGGNNTNVHDAEQDEQKQTGGGPLF
jgi:hypothetical protein